MVTVSCRIRRLLRSVDTKKTRKAERIRVFREHYRPELKKYNTNIRLINIIFVLNRLQPGDPATRIIVKKPAGFVLLP